MKSYNKSLDHILHAMALVKEGRTKRGIKEFARALVSKDADSAMRILEASNSDAFDRLMEAKAKAKAKAKSKSKAADDDMEMEASEDDLDDMTAALEDEMEEASDEKRDADGKFASEDDELDASDDDRDSDGRFASEDDDDGETMARLLAGMSRKSRR